MPASDPEIDRVERLEAALARRSAALGHLQMITKTFVALTLNERSAICDTLLALICTTLEVTHGVVLMCDPETHEPELGAVYDIVDLAALKTTKACSTWIWMADERVAVAVDAETLRERWPEAPAELAGGLAAVSIDIADRPIGLIAIANKRSGEAFDETDLELLAVLGGLAALVITNGDNYRAQRELLAEVERQAEAARHEAAEKQRTLQMLDAQLSLVERQRLEIRELSTPILEVWDRVLVLPVIGTVDADRSADIMDNLLDELVRRRVEFAILDITGVELVDTETASYLIKVVNAAALLGTRCVLTGIRPAVAQTLAAIGVELSSVTTMVDLRRGLDYCIRNLGDGLRRG